MERMLFLSKEKELYMTEFGHSCVDGRTFRGPWTRKIFILHFVVKGTCHFCEFDASEGEAFLIARGEYHSFSIDGDYEHFWLGFSGEQAERLLRVFGFGGGRHLRFRVDAFQRIREMLYEGFDTCKRISMEEAERYARSLLLAFLPYLSHHVETEKRGYDLTSAKKYIEENYPHRIEMGELAARLCVSEKHFCKKFKAVFGLSPRKYLTDVRFQNACELLSETDMKVKDVSLSVGFSSQLLFCDFFKARTGISPTEYRRKKGTKEEK
ncbi:MAG: helix-turn-helix domain-containing protein [Clostridia bacterium]|nr:helix-turn-helix domain-containing protein [Clostridia bacterium]